MCNVQTHAFVIWHCVRGALWPCSAVTERSFSDDVSVTEGQADECITHAVGLCRRRSLLRHDRIHSLAAYRHHTVVTDVNHWPRRVQAPNGVSYSDTVTGQHRQSFTWPTIHSRDLVHMATFSGNNMQYFYVLSKIRQISFDFVIFARFSLRLINLRFHF